MVTWHCVRKWPPHLKKKGISFWRPACWSPNSSRTCGSWRSCCHLALMTMAPACMRMWHACANCTSVQYIFSFTPYCRATRHDWYSSWHHFLGASGPDQPEEGEGGSEASPALLPEYEQASLNVPSCKVPLLDDQNNNMRSHAWRSCLYKLIATWKSLLGDCNK